MSRNPPKYFPYADPDAVDTADARELVIAIGNLTEQVMRLADLAEGRHA